MEAKNKIIKTARVCYVTAKVLYFVSCAACVIFIALAIALSLTDALKEYSIAETASIFGTLALYAFMCIGLLWNVESLFKSVSQGEAPFGEKVSHYLKKSAIFAILVSVVPAFLGTTILRIVYPATEITFPVSFGGIISGVVMFMFGMFFRYGNELQQIDDETL